MYSFIDNWRQQRKKAPRCELRSFLFDTVYTNPVAQGEEGKAKRMLQELFHYYMSRPEAMTEEFVQMINDGEDREIVVCDYIAGMTDNYAVLKFQEAFETLVELVA